MPDSTTPPIDPVSLALASKQIKPEDAAYISDKAAKFGVDPATLGYDLAPVREAWADLDSQDGWKKLAQTPGMADWMIKGHNAAVIQDDLYNTIAVRTAFENSRLPDGASLFELVGPGVMTSVRTVGRGVAWLGALTNPVTAWGEAKALVSDEAYEGSITQSLADMAIEADEKAAQESADIVQRMQIGGNRLQVLTGQILGQAPEMLATGFGIGTLAKNAAKQGVTMFLARTALARGGVAAARITAAIRGSALLQGGYEGSRTLVDRIKGNAEAGRDLISVRDVGAALVSAALVAGSEVLGGLSGEMRSLTGGPTPWRAVAKDIVVQPGQEAFQEFGQSIINDIADGKHIDWTEAQWAALGGALGGTMFAAPTMVSAFASKLSEAGRRKAEGSLQLSVDMIKSGSAIETAGNLANVVNTLAQSKTISRMTRSEHLKMLREAHGVDVETRHFNVADFNTLAEKLGTSADALAAQWGGIIEAGNVTIPHAELAHELAALKAAGKDEAVAFGLEAVRKTPDAASLSDSIALIENMDKRMQALAKDDKPLMPDGVTLDDSAEVAASFEADLVKAGRKANFAKRDAILAAELVRTAADTFNEQYAAAGSDKRVTPKQLWEATKPTVEAGPAIGKGRATYAPAMRNLRITPESDATSVHHEFMHHWIESMRLWEDAPQKIRNDLAELGSFISSRADTVSKYYNKTTKGAKVTADEVREAAAKLHTKEFDIETPAGAAVHEGITAAWEEYLTEGKAPTKKLKRVFEDIASWFRKVYANVIKADKASLDLTGEKLLSDSTRATFSRWLTAADRVGMSRLSPGGAAKLKVSPQGVALIESVMNEAIAKAQGSVAEALKTKAADAIAANEEKARAALTETLTAEVSARPEYRAQNAALEQQLNTEAVTALLNATGRTDLLPALKPFLGGTVDPGMFATAFDAQDPVQLLQAMAQARPLTDVVKDLVDAEMGKQSAATVAEMASADLASAQGAARVAVAEARALRESAKLVKEGEKKEKAAVADAAAAEKALETWRQRAKDKAAQAKLQKDGEKADIARMVSEMRQDLGQAVADGAAFRIQSESLTPTTAKDKADAAAAKATKLAAKGDYEGALNAYYDVETYTEALKQMAKGETSKRRNAVADAAAADYDSLNEVAEWRVAQMPAQLIKPQRMAAIVNATHKRQEKALASGDKDAYIQAKLDEAAAQAMRAALLRAEKKLNDAKNTVAEMAKRSERIELERGGMWMVTGPDGSVQTFASESQAYDAWITGGRDFGGYRMTRADNLTSVRDAIVGILTKRYGGERFRLTEDRPQDRNALRALIWLEESTQRRTATVALAECAADPLKGADALTPATLDMLKENNLDPENWTLRDWQEMAYQMETLQALAKETRLVGQQAADDVDGLIAAARASKYPPQKEKAYRNFWDKVADTILKPQETWRTYLQPLGQMGVDVFIRPGNEAQADMQDALDGASKILTPAMEKLPGGMGAVTTIAGLQTTRWEQLSRVLLWGSVTGRQRVMADFAGRYQMAGQPSRGTEFMEVTLASLTDAEVDFLNAYWASFENLWERQTKVARRVGAAIPPPIQATAFETPHGKKLTGGYAKLRYKDSAAFAEFSLSSGVSMAAIDESMLHERAPKIDGKPLDLSMDVQHQARRAAAKYIGYKPYAVRMSALFRDEKLKGVISTRFGLEYMKGIEEYINFTINGVKPPEASTLDAVAAGWRRNVSMAIYTANALTAPRQLIGVMPAAGHKDVGPRALMMGMMSVMANPARAWDYAKQSSQMMRQRFRDPGQDLAAPDRQSGLPSGWDRMHQLGTYGMRFFQFITDVVVFESARLKALGSGATELEAVRKAESVVTETQSSSSNAEAAKVNRTQMGLLLTMGGKWMISNANMLLRQYREARYEGSREAQVRFVSSVFISLVASNAAMMLSAQILQPKDDGEDKEVTPGDYATKVGMDSVMGMHFALRMFIPAIDAALKGNQGGVASSVAGMGYTPIKEGFFFFNELGREDSRPEKVISSAVGMGSVFGLPSTQIKRVIKATTEESDNGFEALMKAIFGSEYIPR